MFILQSLQQTLPTVGGFNDFSQTFDSVNHEALLIKLSNYGIRGTTLNLIKSSSNNRKQGVIINGHSLNYMLNTTGVPRGSILGLLFFNLCVSDMVNGSTDTRFNNISR